MSLAAGTKLGPYEILSALGAGGMGEVYRARDTRLGRDVAVKILPPAFAADTDRLRRFEQEARSVASLSHPNVVAVHDVGAENGLRFLVTEFLEGKTLRERLQEGALPVSKAVEYALQVARGLAGAHDRGIVHRDLKPENIFLTRDGHAKLLDFGLAKVQSMAASADVTAASHTSAGVVLGTAGYMAPEQVRGEAADHRADIFSFGAILYEMLGGKRAFAGDTSIEVMNAILKSEPPDIDPALRIPPALDRIVRHCLEKNPADRFQTARDLGFALGALSGADSTAAARAIRVPRAPLRRPYAIAAACAALALIAVAYALFFRSGAPAARAQFAIPVPGEINQVAISPDGKWLAFISPGDTGSEPMLYVQRIGAPDARALASTEGASYPFWSPDDAYIGFFADGKLKKVAVAGGEPQNLARVNNPRGGSWSRRGVILYAPDTGGQLWRANADGSSAAALPASVLHATSERWPAFLPDGEHFIVFDGKFDESATDRLTGIYLGSLDAKTSTQLFAARSSAGYGRGRVYFVDENGALVSVPLDLDHARIAGEPRVVSSSVARSPSTYYATFAVSETGTVVYSAGATANLSQLTWFDGTGKELGRLPTVGVLDNPTLSPDGTRVAYDRNDFAAKNVDVWISELRNNSSSRFTFNASEETTPVWSRDGALIAYHMVGSGPQLYIKPASGLGAVRPALAAGAGNNVVPNSWSPDDKQLLSNVQSAEGSSLVVISGDGNSSRPFLAGSYTITNAQISPDGKWVAYASSETGEREIYVTTFPDGQGKWQVSRGGGSEPRWRGDGKEIFYIGPKQMLVEVPVTAVQAFSASAPQPLFQVHPRAPISATDVFSYDVTRDGKRFLVNQYVKPDHVPPLNIVLHADGAEAK
jgi:Tol biopolymer transport system component